MLAPSLHSGAFSTLTSMPSRLLKYLLLVCLAYWACGAAQFVHEQLEHGDPGRTKAVASGLQSSSDGLTKPGAPKRSHHDHDDCPTCQLLAHMSADRPAPAIAVCVHLLQIGAISPGDWRAPVAVALTFAPIRGPPVTLTSAA